MSVLTDALLHLNKEQIMRSMNRWNNSLMLAAIMAAAAVVACKPITAEAKPRGGTSFSRPSVKPSAPPPRVVNRTTNNTTVIRETRVINQGSSGPGIGSTILGTAAGSAIGTTAGVMLGNALSKPDEPAPQQVAPSAPTQQAPVCDPRFFDCTPKVK